MSNKNPTVSKKRLLALRFRILGDFRDRPVDDVRTFTAGSILDEQKKAQRNVERAKRETHGKSAEEQIDVYFAEEEVAVLGDMLETIGQLAIVGLYAKVEQRLKKICLKIGATSASLHTWDQFKEILRKNGIRMETVSGYKTVDELRLCNNAVKHVGNVSEELVRRCGYSSGVLPDFHEEYARFAKGCREFFRDLCDRIIAARGL